MTHPPSEHELERLYHELAAAGAPAVGRPRDWPYHPIESHEHLLALASEMLRYDPRLLSILLHWFLRSWPSLDPAALRRWMHRMRWPQALLVVVTFARAAGSSDPELRHLTDYLAAGWRPVDPPERFFLGMERPGSRVAQRRAGRSLSAYTRWGFIGAERPSVDVFTKETIGRYDTATRQRIAREIAARGPIAVSEYLAAIDHSVSRQQAIADLRAAGLVVQGRGRAARWVAPLPG